ncbi:MAG: AmmeMemoRadiSam system protein B [Bryobacteraceae bacterium]
MPAAVTHDSPYAGSWYPDEPSELRDLLDRVFADSRQRTGPYLTPGALAFVVPHAGIVYSGVVAAAVYRHIEQMAPRRIIVLGFSHRGSPPGLWIPRIDAFRTPLGEILLDGQLARELVERPEFGFLPEPSLCDHSVEIQLPFLNRVAPASLLLPIYVGHVDPAVREQAARTLAELMDSRTVILASSDLTHYGRSFRYEPFPADAWIADRLRDLDESLMEAAGSLRPELFLETLRATGATLCGYEPIGLLLATLRRLEDGEEIFQETLDYQTSGEITGDFRHSVSYAALGYFPYSVFLLGPEDQAALLESARRTLEHYQRTGERRPILPVGGTPALQRRGAAFVTLHKDGQLRGCVGRRAALEPLARTVPEMTLAAALDDTRFPPVARDETGLEIEISVLSPFKRIPDRSAFRVNEHGAVLHCGVYQGLLLPQVATERGWTAEQFFDALARKAGAGPNVYRDPNTRLYVFRAQIIR